MKKNKLGNQSTNKNKMAYVNVESASDTESESSMEDSKNSENDYVDLKSSKYESGNFSNDADNDSGSSDPEEDTLIKNDGWADSVAKILGSNKPKNKKTLVLSRAKKYVEPIKKEEQATFNVVGEEKPKLTEIKLESANKKMKVEHSTARVKPNILEKDRERVLAKIATKGVVQLFNVVKNQQNAFGREMEVAGQSEAKKEKILKSFDKRIFLDTLMGQTKSTIVEDRTGFKDEVKEEDRPSWNALRDDFMMGAKMKDWDKTLEE